MDKYSCKCGQKYFTNSSLYNHIRLKHDNDLLWKQNQLKMGRPLGTKNEVQIKRTKVKRVAYPCKCGSTLASRGALSNHWRLVHKSCEEFKPDVLEKGRKKASYDKKKIKIERIDSVKQEFDEENNVEQNENSVSSNIQKQDEQVIINVQHVQVQVKQENIPIQDLIQVKQEQCDVQQHLPREEQIQRNDESATYQFSQTPLRSTQSSQELTQPIHHAQQINPFYHFMAPHYYPNKFNTYPQQYNLNQQYFNIQNEYQNHLPHIQQFYQSHLVHKQLDPLQQLYMEKLKSSKYNFLLPQSQQQRTTF